MVIDEGRFIRCEGCDAKLENHYWGKVKAEDWFFTRAGEAYCPNHVPEWVAGWRERKKKRSGS